MKKTLSLLLVLGMLINPALGFSYGGPWDSASSSAAGTSYDSEYDSLTVTARKLILSGWDERWAGSDEIGYVDFNDCGFVGCVSIGGIVNFNNANTVWGEATSDFQTLIDNAASYDKIILPDAAFTTTASVTITKPIHIVFSAGTTLNTSSSVTNIISVTSDNVILEKPNIVGTSSAGTTGINVNCTAGTTCQSIKIIDPKVTLTGGASTNRAITLSDTSADIFNLIYSVGTSAASGDDGIRISNTSTQEAATTINIYNPVGTSVGTNSSTTNYGINAVKSSATQNATVNVYNPRIVVTETGTTTSGGINADGSTITMNVYGGSVNSADADFKQANSAVFNVYNTQSVNNTSSGTITYLGTLKNNNGVFGGTLQANDFYSGDGTQGMTGSCAAATTATVKDGLITACA